MRLICCQVQRVLRESGAKPSLLKLELTESTMLENVEDTITKMREIEMLGVSFSMDDFGTVIFAAISEALTAESNQD